MKIYRFVNFLNEVESKIDEVEFLSWLYLLGTEYPTGFVKKSWENDNRMGLFPQTHHIHKSFEASPYS